MPPGGAAGAVLWGQGGDLSFLSPAACRQREGCTHGAISEGGESFTSTSGLQIGSVLATSHTIQRGTSGSSLPCRSGLPAWGCKLCLVRCRAWQLPSEDTGDPASPRCAPSVLVSSVCGSPARRAG